MFFKFFLNLQQYNLTLSLQGKNHTMVLLTVCFLWQQAECLRFICSISWSCIEASGSSIPIVVIPVWLWSNLNKSLAHLKVPTTDRGKWNAYVSPGIHCVAPDGLSLTNHMRAPNARDASVNPHIQLGRVLLDLKSKRWKSELVKERMAYVTTHWGAEETHQNAQGRRCKSPDPAVVIKIWDSRTRKT